MFYGHLGYVAVLLLLVLILLYLYIFQSSTIRVLRKIPGPKGIPIFGGLLSIIPLTREEIFSRDRVNAARYPKIYKEIFLHILTVCLFAPDDVETVLSSSKHLSKNDLYGLLHVWLGTGLLTSTGKKWQTRRKILTPAFHFTILLEFIHIFSEGAQKLVESFEELCESKSGEAIDVVPSITDFTLLAIAETSMGKKLNLTSTNGRAYRGAVYDLGEILTYRMTRPWTHNDDLYRLSKHGKETQKVVKTLHDFTDAVIDERKRKLFMESGEISYSDRKRLAMLDLMLKAKNEGGKLDDEGIREEVDTFMFEGHDTTAMCLCYTLMIIANHPAIQEQIYQEIVDVLGPDPEVIPTYSQLQDLQFTERCLKESLRLYPSVPFIGRTASEDFKSVTGYTIPKDCQIHLHIYDIHRNPDIFPDPEKFDPDRFLPENSAGRHPFAYIPFSAGPRNCIGQKYAMLELKTAVSAVLRKFVLRPGDTPKDLVFISDIVLRTRDGVKVKFLPRN